MNKNFTDVDGRWFVPIRFSNRNKLDFFLFHYAGGSASFFKKWEKDIVEKVNIFALQLPGRENRFNEKFILSMDDLIEKVYKAFPKKLHVPSIFFGHSLGGLISFELARMIDANNNINLTHLIVSACQAPQLSYLKKTLYNLSDNDFISEVRKYNGIPKEILQEPELLYEVILPILRSDLTISYSYKYKKRAKIKPKVTAICGKADNTFDINNISKWSDETHNFDYKYFTGDHFFINTEYNGVMQLINNILLKELSRK